MKYGGWIKPDGEVIEVRNTLESCHSSAAIDSGFSGSYQALQANWVRVVISRFERQNNQLYVEAISGVSKAQLKELVFIAKSDDAETNISIIDDNYESVAELSVLTHRDITRSLREYVK